MTTTGTEVCQSVRQCIVANSLTIWLYAVGMKSANCMKATGRWPTMARPMAAPMMVDSLNGEFITRPGNRVLSPLVTPNTSPLGSSISSP